MCKLRAGVNPLFPPATLSDGVGQSSCFISIQAMGSEMWTLHVSRGGCEGMSNLMLGFLILFREEAADNEDIRTTDESETAGLRSSR